MSYDVVIIGAGPGGLACATAAAAHGMTTIVLERKQTLGRKVCAGGITWNGLLKKVPFDVSEKKFAAQKIFSRFQNVCLTSPTPIIATVDRIKLGHKMAEQAVKAGAEIRLGWQVITIDDMGILCEEKLTGRKERLRCNFLVGADGSTSLVRRYLGIPTIDVGVGITYQIPGDYPEMEWHLDSSLFSNGYAWVFPHTGSASIGAYVVADQMKAHTLQANLLSWADKQGYPLRKHKASAELINFDFRGWHFGNIFLVGDAAGLASGLTGEGIYPAIISGEMVGHYLADPQQDLRPLQNLIKNHAFHKKIITVTGKNRILATFMSEILIFSLKIKLLNFSHIEMAH
jgi:menaquinone-9 beta-reductase